MAEKGKCQACLKWFFHADRREETAPGVFVHLKCSPADGAAPRRAAKATRVALVQSAQARPVVQAQSTIAGLSPRALPAPALEAAASHSEVASIAIAAARASETPSARPIDYDEPWRCGICPDGPLLPAHRRFCPACFAHRGQSQGQCQVQSKGQGQRSAHPPAAPNWACAFCNSSNPAAAMHCPLCYRRADEAAPEPPRPQDQTRWACLVCTFGENHWLADCCAMCQYNRGRSGPQGPGLPDPAGPSPVPSPRAQGSHAPDTPEPAPAAEAAEEEQEIEEEQTECIVCGEAMPEKLRFAADPGCAPTCQDCATDWVEAKIQGGDALSLTCPCGGQHRLLYHHYRAVRTGLTQGARDKYNHAARQAALPAGSTSLLDNIEVQCFDCGAINHVVRNVDYKCVHPACPGYGALRCGRHNKRYALVRSGDGELHLSDLLAHTRVCPDCHDEAGGDAALAQLKASILDTFMDRCPSCSGFVGEPESFEDCLCLKCNHCPRYFCGFCYAYSGDRSDGHEHTRNCRLNPRRNYYVESEAKWRELMRARRRGLARSIVQASALGEGDREAVLVWVEGLPALAP